jgi:ABC-2 type transport system permease protein
VQRLFPIYRSFFASSVQRELEFKANFFANVAQNILWIAFFVLLLKIVYTNTASVAGWNEGDSYVLASTVFFTYALLIVFFSVNLMEIPEKVRKGTLDFDLLKPVDSQFLVSIRRFSFDELGTILGGVVMLWVGLAMSDAAPGATQVLTYLYMIACAVLIFYSFQLIMMTLAIWLVRVDNLWVLGETVYYVARFPSDIFKAQLRTILTYYIPIAFIATEPTKVLLGRAPISIALYATLWTVIFLVISRMFWRFAVNRYSSASS